MEASKKIEKTITTNPVESTAKKTTTRGDTEGYDRGLMNYMTKKLNIPETDLYKMKIARCPAKFNGAPATVYRFFSNEEATKKGFTINDYASLDEHPEMILYEGYHVQGKDGEIAVQKRNGAGIPFLAEKIQKGEISEIGVVKEKTGAQKFWAGFAKFLMYGGFIVVIIVIVGIIILVSMLTK
jgi:hypothetical protein